MVTQRADVVRAAVAHQGPNARQLALARFDNLAFNGVVTTVNDLARTNGALANGVLLEMVMAELNYHAAFHAIPHDQVLRIFQAAPAWTARRFMELVHDVGELMTRRPDDVRRLVEERLTRTRR